MIEEILFNAWSKERIHQGRKICTARHKKYTKDKRVTYISPLLPCWIIWAYFWKAEGADSPEEWQKVIEGIYKRKVPDGEEFYLHFGNFQEKGSEK